TLSFIFYCKQHRTQRSTLFPYTTLFRSTLNGTVSLWKKNLAKSADKIRVNVNMCRQDLAQFAVKDLAFAKNNRHNLVRNADSNRSEEHTSELQSRENLVCRLLLEKKKKI